MVGSAQSLAISLFSRDYIFYLLQLVYSHILHLIPSIPCTSVEPYLLFSPIQARSNNSTYLCILVAILFLSLLLAHFHQPKYNLFNSIHIQYNYQYV